ncbi:MAG: thiolase family protein [Candidatus Omnitrophota bacterium]
MKDVFIVDGLRTPIGGLGKSLKSVSAVDLAGIVIKALLKKHKIKKDSVDEVILGNAVSAGLGQNPARQSLVRAGLSPEIPAFTVNKVCGSGLKSVILAAQAILCGDADIIIAGGTENVSQCPYFFSRDTKKEDLNKTDTRDSLINDGLWCSFSGVHMGEIADYTAEKFEISREEQDKYALESHQKACRTQEKGLFQSEIVPVKVEGDHVFSIDEKPRKNTSMEKLGRIPPAFKPDGTVTAGNSPAPADGAAALILASGEGLRKNKIAPTARILGYTTVAVEPKLVFTAAALAVEKCLKKSSIKIEDVDLFEINEAFAVQAILTNRLTGLDTKRLNIFGGTIALGHPLGASGARGLVTVMNSLRSQKKEIGITSVCLGGGCAISLAVQMI